MFLALPLAPIVAATGVTNTLFFSEAVLDLLGVIAAIWTLWVYVWLPLSGFTRSAFRLFVLGGMTFALLHVLDTIFQVWTVLSKGLPTLIHFGLVLVALVFFVLGLARLADAMSGFRRPQRDDVLQQRWWPLAVALALILGVSSFIIWGLNLLAIFWADVAVDAGIVVLALACAVQVWRTQLGGAIGGALWKRSLACWSLLSRIRCKPGSLSLRFCRPPLDLCSIAWLSFPLSSFLAPASPASRKR